jgi:hypothetical protein
MAHICLWAKAMYLYQSLSIESLISFCLKNGILLWVLDDVYVDERAQQFSSSDSHLERLDRTPLGTLSWVSFFTWDFSRVARNLPPCYLWLKMLPLLQIHDLVHHLMCVSPQPTVRKLLTSRTARLYDQCTLSLYLLLVFLTFWTLDLRIPLLEFRVATGIGRHNGSIQLLFQQPSRDLWHSKRGDISADWFVNV